MKVSVESAGACRMVMRVAAGADEIEKDYREILQAYISAGRVPGFRQGRAPAPIVERRYARQIAEDAKDRTVPRLYRSALSEQKIKPVAIIDVGEIEFNKTTGVSFSVTMDVAPDFKLPKYKKIALKESPVEVTEQQVSDTLARVRESHVRYRDVDGRPVRQDDLVLVDYRGRFEGILAPEAAKQCQGLTEGRDFWVMIGEPEFLPGFNAGLTGAALKESRDFVVHFPADFRVKAAAGKEVPYSVQIKGIREELVPELNEEFFKNFEVTSESALREKLKGDLLKMAEQEEKRKLKNQIAQFLLDKTEFEVPSSIVEEETRLTVRDIVQRNMVQGVTREQLHEQRENIVQAAASSSRERVKLSYVLNRIAVEEKIEVEESEMSARLEAMASRYRLPPEKLRVELEKRNALENLRSEIRSEKTLDFLLENSKIK